MYAIVYEWDIRATGVSSQCAGPGASHLSKLDSPLTTIDHHNSLPIDHHNESTLAVGNQYLVEMLLLEAKMPSNFTISQLLAGT